MTLNGNGRSLVGPLVAALGGAACTIILGLVTGYANFSRDQGTMQANVAGLDVRLQERIKTIDDRLKIIEAVALDRAGVLARLQSDVANAERHLVVQDTEIISARLVSERLAGVEAKLAALAVSVDELKGRLGLRR